MTERVLKWLCGWSYRFLERHVAHMPKPYCKFLAYYYPDARIRKRYLKRLNVHLGEGSYANFGFLCINDDHTPVLIGDHVSIGPNCVLVSSAAANNGVAINQIPYVRDHLTKNAPVVIEDDVWLGASVTILPGVRVGTCSVIGAGSVVTRDVEPYSIYAGVPARKIRELKEPVT